MIKKYQKKNGDTAYMFKTYLGIDPLTGKKMSTTRRGFKSPQEAKIALRRKIIHSLKSKIYGSGSIRIPSKKAPINE